MIIAGKKLAFSIPSSRYRRAWNDSWQKIAQRQLTEVFEAAQQIPFDDGSRIVFFSDCHRGNSGRTDAFVQNRALFLTALEYYYRLGFTYVEVGDGDELWKNRRFSDVRRAYPRVFDLLQRFHEEGRLHLIFGNHDIQGHRRGRVEKDGILAHEGLVLQHLDTGQRIFVLHGHQADFRSDRHFGVSRFVVRHVWRRLQLFGFGRTPIWGQPSSRVERRLLRHMEAYKEHIEDRLMAWSQARQQVIICGHTHCPSYATQGGPPYFNTGSCLIPDQITGLEIQEGQISLVRWSARSGRAHEDGVPAGVLQIERRVMEPPRSLYLFN